MENVRRGIVDTRFNTVGKGSSKRFTGRSWDNCFSLLLFKPKESLLRYINTPIFDIPPFVESSGRDRSDRIGSYDHTELGNGCPYVRAPYV